MIKALKTTKERKAVMKVLKEQIRVLESKVQFPLTPDCDILMHMATKKHEVLAYYETKKCWNFNFESGGWNTVYAKDRQTAIRLAKKEYNETVQRYHCEENGGAAIPLTRVNESTFRIATEADTQNLMSMFY